MIQRDRRYISFFWTGASGIILALLLVALSLFTFTATHAALLDWIVTYAALLLLVFGSLNLYRARASRRAEQRRQRVARAAFTWRADAYLAPRQPAPDAWALQLPTVMRIRLSVGNLTLAAVTESMLLVMLTLGLLGVKTRADLDASPLILMVIIGLALVGVVAFTLLYLGKTVRERIEVTEEGLTVLARGQLRTVRWEDARFFGVMRVNTSPAWPRWYELSGEDVIVRWVRLMPQRRLWLAQPDVSLEEYNQRMDALERLIVAKTGLPLYQIPLIW